MPSTLLERPTVPRTAPRGGSVAPGWAVDGAFAVICALGVLGVLTTEGLANDVVATLPNLVPTVVLAVLLHRRVLPDARAWRWVLVGMLVLDLYSVNWLIQVHLLDVRPPSDWLSVLGLPIGYVAVLVGAILHLRRPAQRDGGAVLDAAILSVGAALALWVGVLAPELAASGTTSAGRIRTLVILVAVVSIGGALVRAAVHLPERRASLTYMFLAIVATLVGTIAREFTATDQLPTGAPWVAVFWAIAYPSVAAAAVHPSARAVAGEHADPGRLTRGRVVLLAGALAVGPLLVGWSELRGEGQETLLVAGGSLLLVPLVAVRVHQLAQAQADAEDRLAHLATRDELTGLPNRRVLDEGVRRVIDAVADGRSRGAVVAFLDLDDFKDVNDDLGHATGDQLLVVVAERLLSVVRPTDLVARFGGDEFVVVLEGEPDTLLRDVVPRIVAVLDTPVTLTNHVVPARASVGTMALRPGDQVTVQQVLSTADARMYERKRARRSGQG